MDINKNFYKINKIFFIIPFVTVVVFALSMILFFVTGIDGLNVEFLEIKTILLFLLYCISLYLIKYINPEAGMHLFLTTLCIGTFVLHLNQLEKIELFLILYFLLIIMSLFLLHDNVDIFFASIFYIMMIVRVFKTYSDHTEIITISLIFFVMVQIKGYIRELVVHKLNSLEKLQRSTIQILGKISEIRDQETTDHLSRVEKLVEIVVEYLSKNKKYSKYIDNTYKIDIKSAAFLHDIGKIGISDQIINKEGLLTKEERNEMQKHTTIGHTLLKDAQEEIGMESIYDLALEIARSHHERWDGTGYPDGLKGDQIPLSARIMSVVDVYDALISKRSYKPPFSHEESISIISEGLGSQFDPDIVRVFLDASEDVFQLMKEYIVKN